MTKETKSEFDPNAIYVNGTPQYFRSINQLFSLPGTPTLSIDCQEALGLVDLQLEKDPSNQIYFYLDGEWNLSTISLSSTVPSLRSEIQNFE